MIHNIMAGVQSILGQFYSGQLRFFRQLCTAAKVETVSQLAHKTLAEGKCIVIGLQSTGGPAKVTAWAPKAFSLPVMPNWRG